MKKHTEELEGLRAERSIEQEKNDRIQRRLIAATDLDDEIERKEKEVKKLSKDKYSKLLQENQVVLIKRLTRKTGFKIKSMEFTEKVSTLDELMPSYADIMNEEEAQRQAENLEEQTGSAENSENTGENPDGVSQNIPPPQVDTSAEYDATMQEYMIDSLDVSINFEASYEQVDAYLKNIQNYSKKIVVSDLVFNSNAEAVSNGTLVLHFYGIRDLGDLLEKKNKKYFKNKFVRKNPESAYIPYPGYVVLNPITTPDTPSSDIQFGGVDNILPGEGNQKEVRLDSFERFDVFFLGNNMDIYGKLRLSSLSKDRANSIRMNYDFFNPAVTNRASMVFDKNKKIIYEDISSIDFDVYLDKSVGDNKLGFTMMDSTGNEKDYYIDGNYNKNEWISVSGTLGENLKYPVMLKSIFIEGKDVYQSVKGELYIDNLRYVAK